MSSNNFNLNILKDKIKETQLKIDELKEKNLDEVEIELYFLENEEDFYGEYPYLIKKLIKGGNLDFLDKMISNLQKVEDGEQSLASTELKLGEELAEKYLYPHVKKD
tara:strand:- start:517 stop:837 length:321 start_codon:yes stop_codon:yes gene_type:complete